MERGIGIASALHRAKIISVSAGCRVLSRAVMILKPRRLRQYCNTVDLDENLDQACLNRSPNRWIFAEEFPVHFVEIRKTSWIGEIRIDLYDILQVATNAL